ncbi:unnamed protein product [Diatraea saccharalis]|uniref:RNA polymerase II-associated protein 1 n=1 Tax=Diatraea saccharalis TaxID=40085 RepID=A0A9N9R7L2_9NEOP|nr:unnamed protein product [Diatraea saccharalis]
MIKRPKPGEGEDDLLQMQEEFLKQKSLNPNLQAAAQVTNLRPSQPSKRASTSDSRGRKPSKYAQSKGLRNHEEKRARIEDTTNSVMGDVLEKNMERDVATLGLDNDNVYFPKVIPSILGNIVERNVSDSIDLSFKSMPAEGFPVVCKHNIITDNSGIVPKNQFLNQSNSISCMDIDQPSTSECNKATNKSFKQPSNLPTRSFVLSSKDSNEIHNENIKILSVMSEDEILQERTKLLTTLDPKIVEYLKAIRQQRPSEKSDGDKKVNTSEKESQELDVPQGLDDDNDTLWENDILSHPSLSRWLHFDSFEKDKLEWMKGIKKSKEVQPNEPYEARFDFKGYLMPYTIEYTESTKSLFHHGEEPHRPGYTVSELLELSRSAVIQQRAMALNTIAGILDYHNMGTYKDVIEIPLSKLFFVIRFAMDENKTIILEPALRAMRNLLYHKLDEACLDALIGFEEGTQQPCLENDKSEIEELDSKETELKDFHLAEIDIISALLRTNILQRLYYILENIKPSFNCVQYSIQILIRLARDSVETANLIIESDHLMKTLIEKFVPTTGINFTFEPEIVYNGKPILSALKLLRVLTLQTQNIGMKLAMNYEILQPISGYISSGVEGTYGLKIQTEAFCILTNLLQYDIGTDISKSLFPVIIMALYKHVQGTNVFVHSSLTSLTHAAVVLQFLNVFLRFNMVNMHSYKQQIYPLLKEGVQKWIMQLASSEHYTCGHLRLVSSILDCCKTILINENVVIKVLGDLLKVLEPSQCFKQMLKYLVPSSNLLSGIKNSDLYLIRNLKNLGTSVVDRSQIILPLLNTLSPLPFLASLYKVLSYINDRVLTQMYIDHLKEYLINIVKKVPSLCDNWFTRMEIDFLFFAIKVAIQSDMPESNKELIYSVSSKLCYIMRNDKKYDLNYIFRNIVFNKHFFSAETLLNLVSLSDTEGFSKVLSSIDDIRLCYSKVINSNYRYTGPNIMLRDWQQPILPRDWIYLPILLLYSKSQEFEMSPTNVGTYAKRAARNESTQKELIIVCSLEWILFYESCFPDLLKDIDITDRFCRIMCVFLCDNSLFLDENVNILLKKCTQLLFKKKSPFNFDKQLTGLHNFQDFYTQCLEQFQSVSYGDAAFAACVLVPIAQKHNVKWRKLLWSEYAGCLRALDCPEDLLCYKINEYLYPVETDESLIRSYRQALSSNLLRPATIVHRIALHHVEMYNKKRIDV